LPVEASAREGWKPSQGFHLSVVRAGRIPESATAAETEPPAAALAETPKEALIESAGESASEASDEAPNDESAAAAAEPPASDMPTARPIAGPSGRRKTKRRKAQRQ
jgi:hypothetical protein